MAASLREVLCFGRYEPLFRVAAGGMAEVYAARIQGEAGFQKLVAVKRMLPHLASDPGFVDMFLNEAKLAAYVVSPHVVQTLDLGRGSDGSLYIVMELVVGLSLAKILEGHPGPLPLPIAIELMAQAAQGLDDAHEATTPAGDALGLIHRDVSPHNILLGIDGRVRVTDFGIARAVHRPRAETNARELKGKFAYMSPEQTRLKDIDRRSDVFSIGIVLWELLAGQRLFLHRDPIECVRLVQKKPVPPPFELRPEVPAPVSQVVLRALERDPRTRFQSAGEVAIALRRAARESWGEPPQKRDIAQFVESSGGDELERLQRLIRLGTEGAAAEAIEALQPGVTRILEGGSGVAPAGSVARRTSVLEGEDEAHAQPTVMLLADEMTPETATAMAIPRRSDDDSFEEDITNENTDPGTVPEIEPELEPPEPPTTERAASHAREDESAEIPTRVSTPALGLRSAPPPASNRRAIATWALGLSAFVSVSFGLGLAIVLLWPDERPTTVLPVASTPRESVSTTATSRVTQPSVAQPSVAQPTVIQPVVIEQPEPSDGTPEEAPERVAAAPEPTREETPEAAPEVEEAPEPEVSAAERARRQRRLRAQRRAQRRAERTRLASEVRRERPEPEPERTPGLLGVGAFDRARR